MSVDDAKVAASTDVHRNLLVNAINSRIAPPYKVVFIEAAADMGGVQYSTLYLTEQLDRDAWQPLVVCPEAGDLTAACQKADVPVLISPRPAMRSVSFRIGKGNARVPNPFALAMDGRNIFTAARNLGHSLAAHHADLIVTKGMFSHFYGGLAARSLNVPCVWHVQDFISERFFGIYRRIFGHASRRLPAHIILDGAAIARQVPKNLQSRATVVHNGVDTNLFRPSSDNTEIRRELGIPPRALVVGNAARMTQWKGQHHLIEAFTRIAHEIPDAYLLLVGSALFNGEKYEAMLREQAAASDVSERIIFAGYRHDLARVLTAMDIFAHTSIEKDTTPLALLSAMAVGLPILAFDIEGVREVIDANQEGLIVPVEDVEMLAAKLKNLFSDDALRFQLAKNARSRAIKDFSLERYVSQMSEVFNEVLRRG